MNSKWNYNAPPAHYKDGEVIATEAGWVDATTGEVLVAIRGLKDRTEAGEANVLRFVDFKTSTLTDDGKNLDIFVVFNEDVDVTGTPQITLDVGGTPKLAEYVSMTRGKLKFRYVTETGVLGQVTASSPLVLNGGTIKDKDTNVDSDLSFTDDLSEMEIVAV